MSARFINVDRETPMLLPLDLRDWVPDNHLVHFMVEAVDGLPMTGFKINHRGTGDAQYPPRMMVSLLVYCYATGRFRSREIEVARYCDVAVRYLCGGGLHPDHDTICTFRREQRREKLTEARKVIEARFAEKRPEEQAEYEGKQSHHRSLDAVWTRVTLAYNIRRLFSLKNGNRKTANIAADKSIFAVAG